MTKQEIRIIKKCADRINYLASLEHASFDINKEKDEKIKNEIRPYMLWFEIVSDTLDELLKAQDEEGYFRKLRLENLEFRNF